MDIYSIRNAILLIAFGLFILEYSKRNVPIRRDLIVYENYPRGLGFYSAFFDKIYLNPIVKKYSRYHEYLIEHETSHYIYSKKNSYVAFILNLLLEWRDFVRQIICIRLAWENYKCQNEFNQLSFSREEIDNFQEIFLAETGSSTWFNDKLMELLRPDGYLFAAYLGQLVISWYNDICNLNLNPFMGIIVLVGGIFYQKNIFHIKNYLSNLN